VIDKLKNIDPELLIEHPAGTVLYGKKVYAFEAYQGTFKGVFNYYYTLSNIYSWPNPVLELVLRQVYSNCAPIHQHDMHKVPMTVSPLDPMITRPRNKWLLIYAVGMISLIILMNICLVAVRHRVSWNISTYSLLSILNVMGLAAFAIALWTYHANKQ
jgi:hypothetical protein